MTTKIAALMAAAVFAATGSNSAKAQTAEEAAIFMVFGLRDKDTAKDANGEMRVTKVADTPLTLGFTYIPSTAGATGGTTQVAVTQQDPCRYMFEAKSLDGKADEKPVKLAVDFTYAQDATLSGFSGVAFAGTTMTCLEPGGRCAILNQDLKAGRFEGRIGPFDKDKLKNLPKHQADLDATLTAFKETTCKPG
ncbi:hypothetical protein O9X90_25740 [Agrobacterium leguminum]|uniref:hypothetical protein n=1 Tax=Agrobacterium leguminum TaxID=2792015 RepID=UPI0022B8374A|nr:hypothetical protein [Agrobacterium leguminum]MCZ7935734.1 hypothetical protein [Agrobacterium leguminum]